MNVQNFRRRFMVGSVPEKELSVSTTYIEFVTSAPSGATFYTYLDGDPTTEGITITSSNTNYITISKYSNSININCKGNKDTTSAKDIIVTVKYMSQTIIVTCNIPADYEESTEVFQRNYSSYYVTSVDIIPFESNYSDPSYSAHAYLNVTVAKPVTEYTRINYKSGNTAETGGRLVSMEDSTALMYTTSHQNIRCIIGKGSGSFDTTLGDKNKLIHQESSLSIYNSKSSQIYGITALVYATIPSSPQTVNGKYVGTSIIKLGHINTNNRITPEVISGVRDNGNIITNSIDTNYSGIQIELPIYASPDFQTQWLWHVT